MIDKGVFSSGSAFILFTSEVNLKFSNNISKKLMLKDEK